MDWFAVGSFETLTLEEITKTTMIDLVLFLSMVAHLILVKTQVRLVDFLKVKCC